MEGTIDTSLVVTALEFLNSTFLFVANLILLKFTLFIKLKILMIKKIENLICKLHSFFIKFFIFCNYSDIKLIIYLFISFSINITKEINQACE